MKASLEEVFCPVCQYEERRLKYDFSEKGIKIVQCLRCSLIYTSPRLNDEARLEDIYTDGYFFGPESKKHGGCFVERENIFRQKWAKDLLPMIEKRLNGKGRLLDVGCAVGILVHEAIRNGWEAYGVELSESAVKYARNQFNVDVRKGTLDDDLFDGINFDVITLLSVLEHMPDPVETLKRVFQMLRPGGLAVIEVPDIECKQSKREGSSWEKLSPEEHLVHFSHDTLTKALQIAGFELESIGGEGGAGILNRLDRTGLQWVRRWVLKYIQYLNWFRILVKKIRHRTGGAHNILAIARKPM